jgi:hypothetical protein
VLFSIFAVSLVMPLRFEAAYGSAIDQRNDLKIFQPRMEPMATPDGVEYQYAIYRGDARHGFGCSGFMTVVQDHGQSVRIFTLDIGQDWVIESIRQLRHRLDIDGDDFDFALHLAEGLVQVFQSNTGNTEEVHYLALMPDAVFEAKGWVAPGHLTRLANGDVVLAQVVVQARVSGDAP